MKTFDVVLTASARSFAVIPLLCTIDETAAKEIADVINKHEASLFQCEGLKAAVRESDRAGEAPPPPPPPAPLPEDLPLPPGETVGSLHAKKAPQLLDLAKRIDDEPVLRAMIDVEKVNPRFPPEGRRTVVDGLEERIGELG